MSVYINQPDAINILEALEGPRWRRLQDPDRLSPFGFYAYLETWEWRNANPSWLGESVAGCMEEAIGQQGDGAIYGEGGYARYCVMGDGELVLLGWSVKYRPEKVELAKSLGVSVTGG